MGLRNGEIVEAVQDRRQEEERQEKCCHDELDIPVDRVRRCDGERQARDEQDDHGADRDREPRGRARIGQDDHREHEHDRRHHGERDELRRDDRERHELPREAHLANQAGVLEQAPRRGLQRCREEDPRRQPAQQEQPVVIDVGPPATSASPRRRRGRRASASRATPASTRAREPIPCTSRADRAGRGSRTARDSGTDRRRRPPRDCTGSVGAHRVRPPATLRFGGRCHTRPSPRP